MPATTHLGKELQEQTPSVFNFRSFSCRVKSREPVLATGTQDVQISHLSACLGIIMFIQN
jgi:hypothetical protein